MPAPSFFNRLRASPVRALLALATLPLLGLYSIGALASRDSPAADAVQPIVIATTPLPLDRTDPGRTQIGALTFLGALQLTSTNPDFGGISGLASNGQGQFLAVTDNGNWLAFRTLERGGRLTGLTNTIIAPLLEIYGEPAPTKTQGDAEALSWNPETGEVIVAYEQRHRLHHYAGIDPARPLSLARPPVRTERWEAMREWPRNGGAESFVATRLPDGRRIRLAISEDERTAAGAHLMLLEVDGGPQQPFGIPVIAEHRPTDAALLDDHRLIIVHRRFNTSGQGVALSLVNLAPALAASSKGQTLPATELARWQAPLTLDNMEGLAITHQQGQTFLYLISDDNQNPLQRTILMKFALNLSSAPEPQP